MNILSARKRPQLRVMLVRIEQTTNTWIFTFGEPYWRFRQKMVLSKKSEWDAAEYMWQRVHELFLEKAREAQWTQH